ncbi:CLIP domain-containing serine protease B15-like [Culex pipiens pallens]|uniref:CLIP domain-containing serine protease B15-like n=1 Tax=Culex pipiens pallens TaxID=42434 RepID=UPI001954C7EA|nr:CLIP domain-containing serine protease B15-like [Culex pipiens pallens]
MIFLFSLVIVSIGFAVGLKVNDTCVTPCDSPGRCVPVRNCSYALKIVRKESPTYQDSLFLEKSRCGKDKGLPLICCPHLLNPEDCGASLGNRIFGGTPTKLEEHPWAAVLMYDTARGRIIPKCGGSLINERYVLTAAHCIRNVPDRWKLHSVRFSVIDVISEVNCTTIEEEEICRQEFGVEQITVHPDYDKDSINKQHDIAIVKLAEDVTFGKYVKPICLPFDELVAEMPIEDEEFTVTGWGQTEKEILSRFQLHVEINGKSNKLCDKVFGVANVTLTENHLCVGGDAGRDSCKGDSGGPLLRLVATNWYQVGVVSFGAKRCGSEGFPGIYTNVAKYLDWISDVVNENHCHKMEE